jgi:hypothetical protein
MNSVNPRLASIRAAVEKIPRVPPFPAPAQQRSPAPIPVLTMKEAKELISVSGFPKPYFVDEVTLATAMVARSQTTDAFLRRPFPTLLSLAKNVCQQESLEANIKNNSERYAELKKEGELTDPAENKQFIENTAGLLAIYLVDGFDLVDSSHFEYDAMGKIVGVNETNKARKPKCDLFLRSQGPMTWRAPAFSKGYGRTRKQKRTIKKTLRRRKLDRKMH